MVHLAVVGARQAGFAWVARLPANGFWGPITLVRAKPHPPTGPVANDCRLSDRAPSVR